MEQGFGSLPLQSCSSSLHKLYRGRVVHSHLHFGHSCWFHVTVTKRDVQTIYIYTQTSTAHTLRLTDDTFLRWRWDDAAVERLLDRQLLVKTQEVTVAPPHREGFAPEHGQGALRAQTGTQDFKNKKCTTAGKMFTDLRAMYKNKDTI